MKRPSALAFRKWLIERLSHIEDAMIVTLDTTAAIRRTARQLGVQPDVLVAARELIGRHRTDPRRRKQRPGTMQFEVRMPYEVYCDWRKLCEVRGLRAGALLRGLIHSYLCGEREPESLVVDGSDPFALRKWRYKGRLLETTPNCSERTSITHGVRRALAMRAGVLRVTSSDIVRGLMLDVLSGKLKRVPVVASSSLYEDESSYFQKKPLVVPQSVIQRPVITET